MAILLQAYPNEKIDAEQLCAGLEEGCRCNSGWPLVAYGSPSTSLMISRERLESAAPRQKGMVPSNEPTNHLMNVVQQVVMAPGKHTWGDDKQRGWGLGITVPNRALRLRLALGNLGTGAWPPAAPYFQKVMADEAVGWPCAMTWRRKRDGSCEHLFHRRLRHGLISLRPADCGRNSTDPRTASALLLSTP
jgi:hypothetical protein